MTLHFILFLLVIFLFISFIIILKEKKKQQTELQKTQEMQAQNSLLQEKLLLIQEKLRECKEESRLKEATLREEIHQNNESHTALLSQWQKSAEERYAALQEEYTSLTRLHATLDEKLRQLTEENLSLQKGKEELDEKLLLQFETISSKLLESEKNRLNQSNQKELSQLLLPFDEHVKELHKRLEEQTLSSKSEMANLKGVIHGLMQQTSSITQQAELLAKALRGDSKVQGDWGEMILENLLEASGLVKGQEYFLQETLKNEKGELIKHRESDKLLRPDVLVKFPDERILIIDSKVSIKAYSEAISSENEEEKKIYLEQHLRSIKNHIKELSEKDYQSYSAKTPDFVVMFIPSEAAYAQAVHLDPSLWNDAYHKRVLIVGPSNLIAVLRLCLDLWKRKKQQKNVEEIIQQVSLLYEKFASYTSTFLQIGKSIQQSQAAYDMAHKQLIDGKGSLTRRFVKFRELGGGLNTRKNLPQALEEEIKQQEREEA